MSKAKKLFLTAVMLPLTLAASGAYAAGGPNGPMQNRGPDDNCGPGAEQSILRQLNLTDNQKKELREQHRKQEKAMRAEMKSIHEQEQAIVLAKDFDQAKATKLAQEMVNLQVQRHVGMLKQRHDMLSVLTKEQKAQFELLKKYQMSQCMKGHHRPGMKGDHGPRGDKMPMPEQP